ncbi:MAG TPA: hypothetical protein VM639_07160 [Dongiaceae bacterium]|nr:hypothetical protein [Dongiaceae bacterium]
MIVATGNVGTGNERAGKPRPAGGGEPEPHAAALPIHELGTAFVLTQLLSTSLPSDTAIEALLAAARRIGWQPVGDVLRSAVERSLARKHLCLDAEQQLAVTTAGRRWLAALMAQNFTTGPAHCADVLLACQLSSAAQLPEAERPPILQAVELEQRDQRRHRRLCNRLHTNALRS